MAIWIPPYVPCLPAAVACFPVGTLGQRYDTIILCKSGHRCDCAQRCKNTVTAIRKHTTLDAALISLSLDLEARDVAGGCNITNGLACADDVDHHER